MASDSQLHAVENGGRKRGRFVPRLLFSLTTLLLALGAVEITLRYMMGKPWYERVVEELLQRLDPLFPPRKVRTHSSSV